MKYNGKSVSSIEKCSENFKMKEKKKDKSSGNGKYMSPYVAVKNRVIHKSSEISDLCGTVAGMVTPKGSMSTQGETLQVFVLPYRCTMCPPLVTRQMSIL